MACEKITGSFFDIQHVNPFDAVYWSGECRFWKEENWRALIQDMNAAGMDTAICIATALWGLPVFPGHEEKVGRPMRMGCKDPLGVCLDEAGKLGMEFYLGIGYRGRCSQVRDYAGMEKPWPDNWFEWNTNLAEALMQEYSDKAGFGGLYIAYEIDFHDHQVELYEKWVGENLRPLIGDTPLLISPGSIGQHPNLDKLPEQLERMDINILAPQDYGGRSRNVAEALELVKGNARAIEKMGDTVRNMGIKMWSNCEVFELAPSPDLRGYCVPGPIERIKEQVEIQAPLVDKLICYQYQGLMNSQTELLNIGAPGVQKLHDDYMAAFCQA